MRAINHALTGALIGLSVSDPLIAAPLAIASHYLMDIVPHHDDPKNLPVHSKGFKRLLIMDAALCLALVAVLIFARPFRWFMAIICAFLAAAPDLLSVQRYYKQAIKKTSWRPGWYSRFAGGIQWFERPSGAIVEAAWLLGSFLCLGAVIYH